MRVGVVGAGAVGASVAWHLVERGADVLLIDSGVPGHGVSNWSFSWVNASSQVGNWPYFDLRLAGMKAHRELAVRLEGNWWHPTGHLRWYDEVSRSADLVADARTLTARGYAAHVLSAREIHRDLEPEVKFVGEDTPVIYYPEEGWVQGRQLVSGLIERATERGLEVKTGRPVVKIITNSGCVRALETSDGAVHDVDVVVNATGPSAGAVAQLVGRALPMKAEPGFVIRVQPGTTPIQRAMHSPDVELRPDGPGTVLLHSRAVDAMIGTNASVEQLSARLLDLATARVPALKGSPIVAAKIVDRPIPLDGFPCVGAHSQVGGYYEAVTHSGMTLAIILGRLLAAEIVTGSSDPLIAPFRPERPGLKVPSISGRRQDQVAAPATAAKSASRAPVNER